MIRVRYYIQPNSKQIYSIQKCYCGGEIVCKKIIKRKKPFFEVMNCYPFSFSKKQKLKFLGYTKEKAEKGKAE